MLFPPYGKSGSSEHSLTGVAWESQLRVNGTTGMLGTSLAATGLGGGHRVTYVADYHPPGGTRGSVVTVNARVWFVGAFLAFFNGYAAGFAGLRVRVLDVPTGRTFSNSLTIWEHRGFVGAGFPRIELEPRTVSVTIPVQVNNDLLCYAEAVQSVAGAGGGAGATSNLSIRVNSIAVDPLGG